MTTLQEVHVTIKELSKENSHIPIRNILQKIDDTQEDLLDHLASLFHLEYIEFVPGEKGIIKLTPSGKLTNIPT